MQLQNVIHLSLTDGTHGGGASFVLKGFHAGHTLEMAKSWLELLKSLQQLNAFLKPWLSYVNTTNAHTMFSFNIPLKTSEEENTQVLSDGSKVLWRAG